MSEIRNISKYLAVTILIGGKSNRFGSDKGLYQIFGKPLISYELETLKQLGHDIFLVAHSNEQVQNYLDKIDINEVMAFIIDDYSLIDKKNVKSPMIGLYSAFKELDTLRYEKTLVLPCDNPLIQKDVIELLIEESKEYDCCIPQWHNGLLEPLLAIYPTKKALVSTEKNIKSGSYKLVNILEKTWKINYISIEKSIQPLDSKLKSFININEPKEIEKINEIIKNSSFF